MKFYLIILILILSPTVQSQTRSDHDFDTTELSYEILNRTIADYLSDENTFGSYKKYFIMADMSGNYPVDRMCSGTNLAFAFSEWIQLNDTLILRSADINQMLTDSTHYNTKLDKKLISPDNMEGSAYSKNKALRLKEKNKKRINRKKTRLVNNFYQRKSISREEYDKGINEIIALNKMYINVNFPVYNNDMSLSLVYIKTDYEAFDAVYIWGKTESNDWIIIYKNYCTIISI